MVLDSTPVVSRQPKIDVLHDAGRDVYYEKPALAISVPDSRRDRGPPVRECSQLTPRSVAWPAPGG